MLTIAHFAKAFSRVLRAAANECDLIADEAQSDLKDWIDQQTSPLGRRRHVAAVRKRVENGGDGAALVGRRALLSNAALAEELASISAPRKTNDEPTGGPEALRAKLGLVGGGRK